MAWRRVDQVVAGFLVAAEVAYQDVGFKPMT